MRDLDMEEIRRLLPYLTPTEKRELDELLGTSAALPQSLLQFVPRVAPRYMPPVHLQPLITELERSWTEEVRVTACAPPRHAKTESVLLFAALTLALFPHKTVAYVTYQAAVARSKSRKVRAYLQALGVQFAPDANSLSEWRTKEGGGLLATGIGGPLTGHGVDLLLVDDPYKNRVDAESVAYRRKVTDWFNDVAETRIEPGGSAFIFHTRWHTDDLIAHVHQSSDDWRHILMPALSDDGHALWPERWPVSALEKKREAVGEYTWASLYQGSPRPRGATVFRDVHYYERLPEHGSIAIGVDLAYSAKTQADRSIAVVLMQHDARWYVIDVIRRQVDAPAFGEDLKSLAARFPGSPMRWYCSGTELGSAQFIKRSGVPLAAVTTTSDKFVRAQPVAAAWNAGRILLPKEPSPRLARDLEEFVRVLTSFTGVADKEDDDVDALAAGFDLLPAIEEPERHPPGSPEAAEAEARALRAAREQAIRRAREDEFGGWGSMEDW